MFPEDNTTNIKTFREELNEECFIEFKIVEPEKSVNIEYFKCTSEVGSGRILMKDFLTYLLDYPQSIAISKKTEISLNAYAFILRNDRIRQKSNNKLIKYYKKIGFSLIDKDDRKLTGNLGKIIKKIETYNEDYPEDRERKSTEKSSTKKSEGGGKKKNKTKKIRYTKRQA